MPATPLFFILAADVAPGGSRSLGSAQSNEGDDFSIAVMQAGMHSPARLCFMERHSGIDDDGMSARIHQVYARFAPTIALVDPGGGGVMVQDKLANPQQKWNDEPFTARPLVTLDDKYLASVGDTSLVMIKRSDPRIKLIYPNLQSDSALANKVHRLCRDAIKSDGLLFPAMWDGWNEVGGRIVSTSTHGASRQHEYDPAAMRKVLNEAQGLTDEERAHAECNLAALQLRMIDRKKGKDGTPAIDSYGMFRFDTLGHQKKDSAMAVVYCYFGVSLWCEIVMRNQTGRRNSSIKVRGGEA